MDEKWRREAEMELDHARQGARGLLWGALLGTAGWLALFAALWLACR